jgi:hypothetical protein
MRRHGIVAAFLLLALSAQARANTLTWQEGDPLTWYLQDVLFTDGTATGWFVYTPPTVLPSDPAYDHTVHGFGTFTPYIELTKFSTGESWLFTQDGFGGNFHEVFWRGTSTGGTTTSGFLILEFLGTVLTPGTVELDILSTSSAGKFVSGSITTIPPTSVPEPGTLMLFALGALATFRRRITRESHF